MKELQKLNTTANNFIADLFKNHNISCLIEDGIIVFKNELIQIDAEFIQTNSASEIIFLQLNIYYEMIPIIEPLAGFGDTYEQASINALENFTQNSFHTILSAFFTSEYDDEVQKYQWDIGEKTFDVTSSNVGVRGELPEDFSMDWVERFNDEIKKQTFKEGVYSARLFYGQHKQQTFAHEVCINDKPQEDLQKKMLRCNFIPSDDFYTVRIFMILKNGVGLHRIAKIIANTESYEEMSLRLLDLGFSNLEIDTFYAYIPEAFGHILLKAMGLEGEFSNKAIIVNDNDEEFPIDLNTESLFVEALELATALTKDGWTKDMKSLGAMSANFNGLNNALNNGSQLQDIDCSCFSSCFNISNYTAKDM